MKVILVTGTSSGLGKSIAQKLAHDGHRVFGTSRRPPSQQTSNDGVTMLQLDVNNEASIQTATTKIIAETGKIDVLINNAGVGLCGAIEDTSIEEAHWQMETNFYGPVRMIQAVLPHMREQGAGRIINIGSMAGQIALPYQPFYSASKFAIEGLTEALRMELNHPNIDATVVQPGDFSTGFTAARVFAQNANSKIHKEHLKKTVSIYEHDETNGPSPDKLAELCAKLILKKNVKPRYSIGRFDQRFGLLVKRLIPSRWFELVMLGIYR